MLEKETNQQDISFIVKLCPLDLFRFFIRKQYAGVEVSNVECDELNVGFAEYLTKLELTELQKENILPKSAVDVIMNSDHPLMMHGFSPAYVYHFVEFIEKMKNKTD